MSWTETALIFALFAAAGVIAVALLFGKSRRKAQVKLGRDGAELNTSIDEEGSRTNTVKNVKITGSDGSHISSEGQGSHITDIEIEKSKHTDIKSKRADK